jgi:hypothetical protein
MHAARVRDPRGRRPPPGPGRSSIDSCHGSAATEAPVVGGRCNTRVPSGHRRVQNGARQCGRLPVAVDASVQALFVSARPIDNHPSAMVRKGSPVRVRQRASEMPPQRGFLVFGAVWMTTSETSGSGRWCASQRRRRTGQRVCRRLVVARSDRSASPLSARVPNGHHSVANAFARLSNGAALAWRAPAARSGRSRSRRSRAARFRRAAAHGAARSRGSRTSARASRPSR